jgi:hypothetical protein
MDELNVASEVPTGKRSRRSRKKTIAGIVAVMMLSAIAAFAYWTASGDGDGSAATGEVEQDVIVNQVSVISNLRPGGAAQELTGTFDNPNDEPVFIATVTATLDSVEDAQGAPIVGCTIADYTLSDGVMTVDAQIPSGVDQGTWDGATLAFDNDPLANQDACQGATVVITYVAA